eukprot:CAMPEP_0206528420 /NCGR_PEP_ID=MMETSP0325_2-20121206/1969_1 /ASSEMBLY_ACC=CAM_ASM_000347 /TAXON_ID=2866 /ORGANISM="Crypthecodinium cohnii, Strain Seligo" /LENGTH=98 /DNA_ID=CAMNT_0054024089 /DNA_START=23 /DNA_END=315 /DNA_ORIENTATION=+
MTARGVEDRMEQGQGIGPGDVQHETGADDHNNNNTNSQSSHPHANKNAEGGGNSPPDTKGSNASSRDSSREFVDESKRKQRTEYIVREVLLGITICFA